MLPAHHCPGSDRVSECLSCNGVILVQERGHRPPPPLPNFTWGSGESVTFLRSLCVASYTEESITFLRSLYVASYPVKSITLLRSMYVASYPVKSITFLRSMYVAGYPEEFITFYLLVATSSCLPLFLVTVGPISVLSMLRPLLRSANGRMTSDQLAKSSFVKINVDSQDRIRLLLIPYH